MPSEREEVLRHVAQIVEQPGNIDQALADAAKEAEKTKRIELANKHELEKLKASLGFFGHIFGSEKHAPIVVAFVVVIFGLLASAGLWLAAFYASAAKEFWSGEAQKALGAALTALAYVFGRASRGDSK